MSTIRVVEVDDRTFERVTGEVKIILSYGVSSEREPTAHDVSPEVREALAEWLERLG